MAHKVADMIEVDGTVTRLPRTVAEMGLAEIQAIVGGYVEHADGMGRTELWCNENGAAKGLPYNPLASIATGHYVVGNVVVEHWE